MKKIQLLVLSLLFCSYLIAQQKKVSEIATITFPSGTQKLTDRQIQSQRIDSKSPVLKESLNSKLMEHYLINSFFLELHAESTSSPKFSLEDIMKNVDQLNKETNGNSQIVSGIKKVNNYDVFISQLDSKEWGNYSFFAMSKDRTKSINGMLHYENSDTTNKDKALTALNEVLQSMTFK